ncbi:MAG: glycosyltransferase family 39 protein [Planctomycetes bacterium]|nr:glycosyltransferase family 39 protein [Planctomycetota bacterium]
MSLELPGMKKARHTSVCLALSLLTAVVVFTVSGNPAAHMDTLSDEKVDGQIANSLRQDPFFGNRELAAPARFRLPMYLDALVGASLEDAKGVPSRNFSRSVAVITIVATAGLACSLFGFGTGWLSAIILAISPYFLAYSGLAGTEGDVFAACFVTLALWAYVSYLQSPTPAKWLLAGCMLACAIGTTIFAVYLLVVFWLLSATMYSEPTFKLSRMPNHTARLHRLLRWQLGVISVTFALAVLHRFPPGRMQLDRVLPIVRMAAICGWVALAALWTATVSYVVVVGVLSRSREERFWGMAAFAFCTVFVLMPVHLLDPSIAKELLIKVGTWDGGFPFGSIMSHVRLYSGIFLLKMTIPLGIVAIISIVYGVFNERNDGRWRSIIWAILLFLLLLCSLPNRRSQNLMAIYPLIAIVTAAGLAGITRRVRELRSGPITTLWLLVAAGSVGYLGFESWRAHPNYQQYGADILASRFDWKWLAPNPAAIEISFRRRPMASSR